MDDEIENGGNDSIPCNTIVFRVLLKKDWIDPDNNAVLAAAYIPRTNGQDDKGLSVEIATFSSYETLSEGAMIIAIRFNRPKGVASLHTGKVRDLNIPKERHIDIIKDSQDDFPDHALIVGIPIPIDDEHIPEMEKIAGELARLSRII